MRFSRRASALSAVGLLALFVISALPQSPVAKAATAQSASAPTFTPEYLILGQLRGTTVDQSQRPRSATITGSYQFAFTYYGAGELQSAYGASSLISAGYDGRGKTIAVIDAYGDPTIYEDLATFDRLFGLPPVNLTVIPVGPYEPRLGITYGWDAETALDVEAAHAMAPYAKINLVVAANASNALFEAVKLVVEQRLGDVVTMSWGLGENSFGESGWSAAGFLNYPYVEYWFQRGAAEGMTFFASSGDNGAFGGTTTVTATYPASSPFVTGVGGTTLFLTPQSGPYSIFNASATYEGEAAWSVSPQYVGPQGVSSGGGYSDLFAQPYYQAGAVNSKVRASPDVAAVANPYTGMVVVLEGGYYAIGGTSLSSPLWAGMAALIDQYAGRNLGLLNPYLYSVYGNSTAYARDFHQVTSGYNGAYQAGPGYNLVTGIGSPNLPLLAADIKSQAQGLTVDVSTSMGSSSTAPTQYRFGESFSISAAVTTPQGSTVGTGSFAAKIEGPGGAIATVPLTYSAGSWTGTYAIPGTAPPGQWSITVSGSSGGISGYGAAEVNVGDSLGILGPVPYPYGSPIEPGVPFTIQAVASTPGGTPINNATLTAELVYGGTTYRSVTLLHQGNGFYVGQASLSTNDPQGSYELVISGPQTGSVYSYLYVGEAITGVMITPNDEAIPSASPGQQVTLLARAETAGGNGLFTSNVTAKILTLSGSVMASVKLRPAPNSVQFGVFNFFGYQQANFTIPSNLTAGFYQLQFLSSYQPNASAGAQQGKFTTGFYVGGPTLSYAISATTTVFEGQYLTAVAKITDSTGAPVTSGVFLATFIPSGYVYESYLTDIYGYTSVPMYYDPSLGGWAAEYQIPSVLTSPNSFVGNLPSLPSGPWTVFVSGQSADATNVVPSSIYVNVLPYTYYTEPLLTPTSVQKAPLVTSNGTGYSLSNIAADSLAIRGLDITLIGVTIGNLTLDGSTVRLVDSKVGSITATNSTLTLVQGTKVGGLSLYSTKATVSDSSYLRVTPSLPTMTVSGLSQPLGGSATFTVSVAGEQLTNASLAGSIDGSPVALSVTASSSGLTAKGTVDAASLGDGVHVLTLTATQSDGLSSTLTTYFSVSTASSAIATLSSLMYVLVAVALIALGVSLLALWRRPKAYAPPLPPQV